MYKVIGRYGEWDRYSLDLGENTEIEHLVENVANRLNSIKPRETIRLYVYKNNELVGRIIKRDEYLSDNGINIGITCPLTYLNNEEFSKWQEKRMQQYGIK